MQLKMRMSKLSFDVKKNELIIRFILQSDDRILCDT